MQKSIFAIVLIAALGTAAITTTVPYLQQVYADPDSKEKEWEGEIIGLGTSCTKHVDCKDIKETEGANINKITRELCEDVNDGKCKQIK